MLTARKHCVISILFTISLVTCVEVGATKTSAKSKFFENWREDTILKKGKNMNATSDQTASSVHPSNAGNKYVGVALNIRNQSPFRLAKPTVYKDCGYEVVHFSNMNQINMINFLFTRMFTSLGMSILVLKKFSTSTTRRNGRSALVELLLGR